MRKLLVIMMLPVTMQAQPLEECQQAAERNYPLIRQYDLIGKTTALTTANLDKGWLPQVTASAQATWQSDVTAWPQQMQQVYQQLGIDLVGLRKDQYRVGIDVQQLVYDGGTLSSQKEIARRQGEVQAAQNEVSLYQVRKRVNDLYFGLLLLDQQLLLNRDLQEQLRVSEERIASMVKHGTAAESDHHSVKAERLGIAQQQTELAARRKALTRLLSELCGMEVSQPVKPSPLRQPQAGAVFRPELKAIEAQLLLADAQERALNTALRPKVGLFAQGFYGYPGLNLFEDMMHHRWSLGAIVGARLSWNLGALYTRKNDRQKLALQRSMFGVQRETFLLNNRMEQIQQTEDMERYRQQMAADAEIVALRTSVRRAAESKLAHGIIDVNDLVSEINREHAARVQQSVHEIELLKDIYDYQFTTNQ